jgi:hypothetical protein
MDKLPFRASEEQERINQGRLKLNYSVVVMQLPPENGATRTPINEASRQQSRTRSDEMPEPSPSATLK